MRAVVTRRRRRRGRRAPARAGPPARSRASSGWPGRRRRLQRGSTRGSSLGECGTAAIVGADGATSHHPAWVIPGHPSGSQNRTMGGRRIGVGALLVIGTLLWTGLGFAVWANRQALDTDNWVDTSGDLLEDDEIRTA